MKKFFIYSGLIIFILLLSYLTVSFWLVQSTAGRAQARRAAIAAAGDNVYLTDYETEPIPDEENAYHYLMLASPDLEAFQKDWQSVGNSLENERRLRPEQVDALAAVVEKYPALFERLEKAAVCEQYQAPTTTRRGWAC